MFGPKLRLKRVTYETVGQGVADRIRPGATEAEVEQVIREEVGTAASQRRSDVSVEGWGPREAQACFAVGTRAAKSLETVDAGLASLLRFVAHEFENATDLEGQRNRMLQALDAPLDGKCVPADAKALQRNAARRAAEDLHHTRFVAQTMGNAVVEPEEGKRLRASLFPSSPQLQDGVKRAERIAECLIGRLALGRAALSPNELRASMRALAAILSRADKAYHAGRLQPLAVGPNLSDALLADVLAEISGAPNLAASQKSTLFEALDLSQRYELLREAAVVFHALAVETGLMPDGESAA